MDVISGLAIAKAATTAAEGASGSLAKAGLSQAALNKFKAVVPFLIAQSETLTNAYFRYRVVMAEGEALSHLIKDEAETRTIIKRELLKKRVEATDEERLRINRELEGLDQDIRHLDVVAHAFTHSPKVARLEGKTQPAEQAKTNTANPATKEIGDHWLDHFNELSRKRNEPWRARLLSRALEREADEPGSVSPRAVWLIGNLEESLFEAFAALLDACPIMYPERPFLPNTRGIRVQERTLQVGGWREKKIGEIVWEMSDAGLLADTLQSHFHMEPGKQWLAFYGSKMCVCTTVSGLRVTGLLLTPMGNSIASFYEPTPNAMGASIWDEWIAAMRAEGTQVDEHVLPDPSAPPTEGGADRHRD